MQIPPILRAARTARAAAGPVLGLALALGLTLGLALGAAPPARAAEGGLRLVFLGADPGQGAPGAPGAALPVLAIPALPEAAAARGEVTAALLRASPVTSLVAAPDARDGHAGDLFLVADAAVVPGEGVRIGGVTLPLPEVEGRLRALVEALAPAGRQIAFVRLADPAGAFPAVAAELRAAIGASGFAMTVLMVGAEAGAGACAAEPARAVHFPVVAGVADRAPFGNADGRSTMAEVEAFLVAALTRAARRGGPCAPLYSLIVKAEADPERLLAVHAPAPLFPEMEQQLFLESFEAMFLLRSDDRERVRGFLEACVYCPNEAALVERLRAMRERETALALESQIWDEIRGDATPERLEIYLANCTLCAFRAEAEARLAELRAAAEAREAERRALARAMEARDLTALRDWLAACTACEGRAEAERMVARIEADAAYLTERAALAEAVASGDAGRIEAWLAACRVCDGRPEAEAALARAARRAALAAPCLAAAGLPQQGGPRRLEAIDRAAAAAACGAALAEFPADPELRVVAGRIAQAAGRRDEARAAYEAGLAADLPAAYGLAAFLDFAPPPGTAADLARAELLALDGAARGDWLSREILVVLYSGDLVAGRGADDAAPLALALAAEGNAVGQFFAGYFHLTGTGLAQSDAEAARWLGLAVDQGYVHAYSFLAEIYEDGRGVPAQPDRAADLYWAALAAGDTTARDRLTGQLAERNREVIRLIQERLREAGVYTGRVDGLPGPGTVAAVQRFVDSRAQAG